MSTAPWEDFSAPAATEAPPWADFGGGAAPAAPPPDTPRERRIQEMLNVPGGRGTPQEQRAWAEKRQDELEASEKQTAQRRSGLGGFMGVVRDAIGVAEVIGKEVSGVYGMLKGGTAVVDNTLKHVARKVTGGDTSTLPTAGQAFAEGAASGTYEPRTEEGQEIDQGPVMREIRNSANAMPPARALSGARAVQTTKALTSPKGLARIDDAIKTTKLEAPVNEGIKNAIDAGYKLTPKAGNAGKTARSAQTAAGSARLEQELSAHNSEVTSRLVRKDLGLPDDVPLTREATEAVRREAGGDYEVVRGVGRIELDSKLASDLDRIAEPYIKGGKDFDSLATNPIIKTVEGLRKTDADTNSVIEVVKDLRNKADVAGRAGDKKLAGDYRAAAGALDNAMDRALGKMAEKGAPELAEAVDKYRAARVRIAKSYLAEDAMDGKPGEINAKVYARALKKGARLDGEAKQVADFAQHFGDEGLAKKAGKSGHVGMTYHDILLGALHLPAGAAGAIAGAVARPATRAVLGSDWSQRRMKAKAERNLPAKVEPEAPAGPAPLELAPEGPLPAAERPAGPASPLGDTVPDWETAPGARPDGAPLEVVPTEGLVQAVDEVTPMRPGPASPAVRRGAGGEIPAVPGRPDLPDTMITGAPAEAAGDAATGAAMLEPGAQQAMRNQQTARNIAQAEVERNQSVPVPEVAEIPVQNVTPAGSPKVKEPPAEKLPVGEATEIKPEVAKPAAAPPKTDERVAGLERMRATAENDTVRKVIDKRIAAVKKELADETAATKRRDDAAELRRTAALTEDPDLKAALFEEAKAIEKADAVPAPKAVEGQPEIKVKTPEKLPTGKATELEKMPGDESLPDITESHVGRKWVSPEGERTVEAVRPDGKLMVTRPGIKGHELVSPDQLESTVRFDERAAESRKASQAKQAAIADTEAKEAAKRSDMDGFGSDKTPVWRKNAEEALNKNITSGGRLTTRKDLVRDRVESGAEIVSGKEGRRLQLPDGRFLGEAQISKTAMDYAEHLIAKKGGKDLADLDLPRIDEGFLEHQQRAQQRAQPAPEPAVVERGRRQTRAALEKGREDGSLGKDEADLALWALDKNPNLARGLRFETDTNGAKDPARAVYNTVERVVKAFTNKESDPQRAVHEILHHSERMMPAEVQRGIRREWRAALEAEIKKSDEKTAAALRNIQKGITGGKDEFEAMKAAFRDGVLDRTKHYHLTNPSEFWAVNAARILGSRHTSRNAWQSKAVQWTKEMVERVKGAVGLRSDSPVLKALAEVMDAKKNEGLDRSPDVLKTGEAKSMLADRMGKPTKEERRATYRKTKE